jgi:hypothetical protein
VHVTKQDGTGTMARAFGTGGGMAMAHVPQMYSLYELYFAAALRRAAAARRAPGDATGVTACRHAAATLAATTRVAERTA